MPSCIYKPHEAHPLFCDAALPEGNYNSIDPPAVWISNTAIVIVL